MNNLLLAFGVGVVIGLVIYRPLQQAVARAIDSLTPW